MSSRQGHEVYFRLELFKFFEDLGRHNERDWFLANKDRYETFVRQPLLAFVTALGSKLRRISSHFGGGKVMRINRDIRFSADKTPYRTHAGVMFGHSDGGEGPSPGFYLHFAPEEVFVGSGLWTPDTATQNRIRNAIVKHPDAWEKASRPRKGFPGLASMHDGETLKRPPRGFDPNHKFVDDLRRKHFIATVRFHPRDAIKPQFLDSVAKSCEAAGPLVKFLVGAVGLKW